MDERIKDHLQYLNKYYLQLADMRKLEPEAFSQDGVLRGAAERFLQLAIESCLNIGNRIIALYQIRAMPKKLQLFLPYCCPISWKTNPVSDIQPIRRTKCIRP